MLYEIYVIFIGFFKSESWGSYVVEYVFGKINGSYVDGLIKLVMKEKERKD